MGFSLAFEPKTKGRLVRSVFVGLSRPKTDFLLAGFPVAQKKRNRKIDSFFFRFCFTSHSSKKTTETNRHFGEKPKNRPSNFYFRYSFGSRPWSPQDIKTCTLNLRRSRKSATRFARAKPSFRTNLQECLTSMILLVDEINEVGQVYHLPVNVSALQYSATPDWASEKAQHSSRPEGFLHSVGRCHMAAYSASVVDGVARLCIFKKQDPSVPPQVPPHQIAKPQTKRLPSALRGQSAPTRVNSCSSCTSGF